MGLDIEALDRLEPGAALAEALAQVDSASLSGYDRVVVLKAQQRQVAHYQAQAYWEMAAIVSLFLSEDDDYECAYDSASAEIAAALHLTRRAADSELGTAMALFERIPEVGNGITRRRPTTAQRRQIEARNPTCIHPGCRAPAINADIYHRIEYAYGGPTHTDYLDPYCAYHHTIRHRARWTRTPLKNRDHLHQSRLGHKYTNSGRSP